MSTQPFTSFEPLQQVIGQSPQAPRRVESAFRWATVTGGEPLRIRLDGDTTELPFSPDSLVSDRLYSGQRVWVQIYGRRVIVLGVSAASTPRAGVWEDYTPAVTASEGTVSLGTGGSSSGRWTRIGDGLLVQGFMSWGTSPDNPTGNFQAGLPVQAAGSGGADFVGTAYWSLAGRTPNLQFGAALVPNDADFVEFRSPSTTTIGDYNTWTGAVFPGPMVEGDLLRWSIFLEGIVVP